MMCSPMDEDELTQVGPLDVRVLNRRKRFFLFGGSQTVWLATLSQTQRRRAPPEMQMSKFTGKEYHLSDLRHRGRLRSEAARSCLFKIIVFQRRIDCFPSLSLPQLPKSQTLPLAFCLHPPTTPHPPPPPPPTPSTLLSALPGVQILYFLAKNVACRSNC